MADEQDELMPSQQSNQPPFTQIDNEQVEPENCIKILLATDNHIGYSERDPVRGQDSINTFKEILELAVENDVDMLLLAGDLFHENKPSRTSLYQTISLLREHTLGRKPVSLQLVSDAGVGLGHQYSFPQINYEDENFNVGLPVFSIHGNHDDPQGSGPDGALCALDILSASGLLNYFGRQELPGGAEDDEEAVDQGIQVKPVLLQKGRTKLAMYGIGNVRDERFHAEMRKQRISMFRPEEDPDSWFNLLLIHQNRVAHGPKSSVPENGFGDEVHLVVWGHEHDCRITPEDVTGKNYKICQPGSSVATSLAAGESLTKHVALLKIQDTKYNVEPIQLRTVRPFIFDDVCLAEAREDGVKLDTKVQITKYLKEQVEQLVTRANQMWDESHGPEEERMLPLIRLRVDFSPSGPDENFDVGNPQRFGVQFADRVANPKDIVQFHKKRVINRKKKIAMDQPEDFEQDDDGGIADESTGRIDKVRVEQLVQQYLEAQQLQVIPENGIMAAVEEFVDKDDRDAIKEFVKTSLGERQANILNKVIDVNLDSEDEVMAQITEAKGEAVDEFAANPTLKKGKKTKSAKGKSKAATSDEGSDFEKLSDSPKGKKKAPAKKATAASKKKKEELFNEDSDEESDEAPKGKKKAVAKKATPKAAPKKAAPKKQATIDFAPQRGSRAAATKASKKMAVEVPDSDEDDMSVDYQGSSSDGATKKKSGR